MDSKELTEIGLTNNQAKVYLELVKRPEQTGGEIAKKLLIDRSFTYGILNSLVEKGMIGHIIKENKKVFITTNPENLLKEVEEKKNKISKIVEELKKIKSEENEEKSVEVYEGKAGIKAFVREFLESEEFSTLGGGGTIDIIELLKYDYPKYLREFENKDIKGRLITSKTKKKQMTKIYKKAVQIKTAERLKSDVSFTIFDNKIAIYSAEKKPYVIMIKNKNIAESLKAHFENSWKNSEK